MKGGGSSQLRASSRPANYSLPYAESSGLSRKMTILDVLSIGANSVANLPANYRPEDKATGTKLNMWDTVTKAARVYTPPELKPASIEKVEELVGSTVAFVKIVREAQSQFGHSILMGIVVAGNDHTDTVWLSEKTVLYRQVTDEIKKGPFVANIAAYQSAANPGQSYYSLADPNSAAAVESRVTGNGTEDLPF